MQSVCPGEEDLKSMLEDLSQEIPVSESDSEVRVRVKSIINQLVKCETEQDVKAVEATIISSCLLGTDQLLFISGKRLFV